MTKTMFVEEMVKTLEALEDVEKVEVRDIQKNNGVTLTGVIPHTANTNIYPTFYAEDYYADYTKRQDLETTMQELRESYEKHRMSSKFDIDSTLDFEKVEGKIYPRIANYEKNREELKNLPHRRVEDLVIYYVISLSEMVEGVATTKVNYPLLDKWGVTEEDLYSTSIRNLDKVGFKIQSLAEFIPIPINEVEDPQLYVVTTDNMLHGSCAILNTDLLDEAKNRIGDFYIIPSSIHEILLTPISNGVEAVDLANLIKEVNSTQVDTVDQLSDTLYMYDGEFKVA